MSRVLLPLPDRDFDTTEVAVPWRYLVDAGHEVVFATERGAAGPVPGCDPLLLSGVIFGQLGAEKEPKSLYSEMTGSESYRRPLAWADIRTDEIDALMLPGGHAAGMRQYLSSPVLQAKVAELWLLNRPVGAICHGVLVLARTIDARTGRSVLCGKQTTCLPKYMERTAYLLTAWKLGRYYRTYPAYVEDEVTASLRDPQDFRRGPYTLSRRGTATDDSPAFVVRDGNYLSARWPGDSYRFARTLVGMLAGSAP
jgi:putative intracellular protease/amidase